MICWIISLHLYLTKFQFTELSDSQIKITFERKKWRCSDTSLQKVKKSSTKVCQTYLPDSMLVWRSWPETLTSHGHNQISSTCSSSLTGNKIHIISKEIPGSGLVERNRKTKTKERHFLKKNTLTWNLHNNRPCLKVIKNK